MTDPLNPQISPLTETTLAPGVQWAQSDSPSLKKTRLGLSLITLTIVIMVICILGMSFGVTLFMGTEGFKEKGIKITIRVLHILAASLLYVVGPVFCLAAPAESGAKRFLVWSIVLSLISIMNSIIQVIAPMEFPSIVQYFIDICGYIGFVMFMVFIKKLSEYIGRNDLAARSKTIFISYLIYLVSYLSIFAMSFMFLVAGVAVIVFLFMYFNLINALRQSLGRVD